MLDIPMLMVGLYILIFVLGVLILIKAFPARQRIEIRWLLFFAAILCFISFCSLNVYVQSILQNKIFFSRIRFLGFSLLGQAWFYFVYNSYSKERFFRNPLVVIVSFVPALVTWATVLIPPWNEYFTLNYQPLLWHGATLVTFDRGPWSPFHIIWCHLFAWLGVFYTLYLIPRMDKAKRRQLIMLSIGGFVATGVDLLGAFFYESLRWAMISSGTTFIAEGAILYSITRQGLLDLTLVAREHIYQKIPDPILTLNNKNQLIDFNSSAQQTFQLNDSDKFHLFEDIPNLKVVHLNQLPQEVRLYTDGTETRYFHITNEPLSTGTFSDGRVILCREITAQKIVEQKLSHHLEFKARLLSMIAHDFSGVIESQAILSSSIEEKIDSESKPLAKILVDSTFASKDFLTNILLWAKSQENQFQPQVQPFEMNMLVKDVINDLENTLRINDIEIVVHSEKDPILMNGDDVMLESVIRNLLMNAIRASKARQKIEIFIKDAAQEVKVLIKDEGSGMSAKKLEAIQRSSIDLFSSDPEIRPSGFGVGLAIARRFIELHQGSLLFQTEEGKGTLVTLTLPI